MAGIVGKLYTELETLMGGKVGTVTFINSFLKKEINKIKQRKSGKIPSNRRLRYLNTNLVFLDIHLGHLLDNKASCSTVLCLFYWSLFPRGDLKRYSAVEAERQLLTSGSTFETKS